MLSDTPKFSDDVEREAPHSAFAEFSRDERRPAVLLLAGLVIAALFFTLGILFGRWTSNRPDSSPNAPKGQQGQSSPVNQPKPTPSVTSSPSTSRGSPKATPSR